MGHFSTRPQPGKDAALDQSTHRLRSVVPSLGRVIIALYLFTLLVAVISASMLPKKNSPLGGDRPPTSNRAEDGARPE